MRLVDVDALKNDLICFYPEGVPMGLSPETLFKQILQDIDNAPIVCHRYRGFCVPNKDAEPKEDRETACNVLLSIEQIVRNSDGWDEDAIQAVHDAVQLAVMTLRGAP